VLVVFVGFGLMEKGRRQDRERERMKSLFPFEMDCC